jgi:uncharacterized protein YacL (UPF0231 family)
MKVLDEMTLAEQSDGEGELIDRALRAAIRDTLREHKRLGHEIAVWRDGKVVILPADQIEIHEEETEATEPTAGSTNGTGH